MQLTTTQLEVYRYFDSHNFVSPQIIAEFRTRLEGEGPLSARTLSYAMEKFLDNTCPNCQQAGAFKFHFMGRLKHNPGCSWSWYVGPGTYSAIQLSKVLHAGVSAGGGMMEDATKKQEKGGCIYAVFGFIFGAIFRLVFAVLMIPIQTIFSLTQSKPNPDAPPK